MLVAAPYPLRAQRRDDAAVPRDGRAGPCGIHGDGRRHERPDHRILAGDELVVVVLLNAYGLIDFDRLDGLCLCGTGKGADDKQQRRGQPKRISHQHSSHMSSNAPGQAAAEHTAALAGVTRRFESD